jgi:hypothetical protein
MVQQEKITDACQQQHKNAGSKGNAVVLCQQFHCRDNL